MFFLPLDKKMGKMASVVGGSFSQKIAEKLGISYHPVKRRVFPDGEVCPRVDLTGDLGTKVFFILRPRKYQDPNSYLVEFLITLRNLKESVDQVHVFMPYMVYARQDATFREGEPFSSKIIADLIVESGAVSFTAINMHLHRIEDIKQFFPSIKVTNLSAIPYLARYTEREYELQDPFILAPDDEALKWAREFAKCLNIHSYEAVHKKRDPVTGEVETEWPDLDLTGRDLVIVDDIIATGGTMINAVKKARRKEVASIIATAVHPVLTDNALEKLKSLDLRGLFTTNTIPSPLNRVDVRPLIVEEIKKKRGKRI